jgi:hypothetical protein
MVSRHEPEALYHAANVIFKSSDRGLSWNVISPDLTRNDKTKQGPSGGPITRDNVGTEFYCTIFALAESPLRKGLIWAGSDDGLVHLTRDDGGRWTNVTPAAMPEWSLISTIEPSPHDPGAAYLAVDRHKFDDLKPYIYRTADYGATWTAIGAGIPQNAFVHVVREDPVRKDLLYAGTEAGVFVSFDAGSNWLSLQLNLPMAPVHDLAVKQNDLVVATHGRAFWILDDVAPLRELATPGGLPRLYLPSPAYRVRPSLGRAGMAMGENPPTGAILYYSLASEPKTELTLSVFDDTGRLVRTFSSRERPDLDPAAVFAPIDVPVRLPTRPGLNRFVWNLRYPPARAVPGVLLFWHSPVNPPVGPMALPGNYEVRLTVEGTTLIKPLQVLGDRRVSASPSDLGQQFRFLIELRDRFSALTEAINTIAHVRQQLSNLAEQARDNPKLSDVASAVETLDGKVAAIEERLVERRTKTSGDHFHYPAKLDNKLSLLMGVVANADDRPTEQARAVFEDLRVRIDRELSDFERLQAVELPRVNGLARRAGLAGISR